MGGATSEQTVAVVNAAFYAAYASDARGAGAAGEDAAEAWPKFFARLERRGRGWARRLARLDRSADRARDDDRRQGAAPRSRRARRVVPIGTRLDPAISRGIPRSSSGSGPSGSGTMTPRSRTGRSLRQTAPWGIRAPMIFLDALNGVAGPEPEAARFWRQGSVCDDVQSLYEGFSRNIRTPAPIAAATRCVSRIVAAGRTPIASSSCWAGSCARRCVRRAGEGRRSAADGCGAGEQSVLVGYSVLVFASTSTASARRASTCTAACSTACNNSTSVNGF